MHHTGAQTNRPTFSWLYFQGISSEKIFRILIEILLRFVPRSLIDKESSVGQVMAWYLSGGRPLPESVVKHFTDECIITRLHRIISLKITRGIQKR